MMATDMPAAISAYSMTVAPPSSRAKRARSLIMFPALQRPFGMAASQSPARFDIVAQFAKIECNSVFFSPRSGQRPAGTYGSKRTYWEISQPQIGKTTLLPDAEQRPIQREPHRVIALFNGNSDAFAEVAAVYVRPAAEGTAILGIGAVEPEGERDRIAEQEIDITAPRSEEHTSELQSHSDLVCRLLLEKKKQ